MRMNGADSRTQQLPEVVVTWEDNGFGYDDRGNVYLPNGIAVSADGTSTVRYMDQGPSEESVQLDPFRPATPQMPPQNYGQHYQRPPHMHVPYQAPEWSGPTEPLADRLKRSKLAKIAGFTLAICLAYNITNDDSVLDKQNGIRADAAFAVSPVHGLWETASKIGKLL